MKGTFEALWREIEQKYPQLKGGNTISMRPAGFKRALRLAYDRGTVDKPMEDLFGKLFR